MLRPMNHEEIIRNLRDIHMPKAPHFWPLAYGYYGILIIGLIFILFIACYFFKSSSRRMKKAILREFFLIESNFRAFGDVALLQASLAGLLKRLAFFKDKELKKNVPLTSFKTAFNKIFLDPKKTAELV